jgi:hypothetical protein
MTRLTKTDYGCATASVLHRTSNSYQLFFHNILWSAYIIHHNILCFSTQLFHKQKTAKKRIIDTYNCLVHVMRMNLHANNPKVIHKEKYLKLFE